MPCHASMSFIAAWYGVFIAPDDQAQPRTAALRIGRPISSFLSRSASWPRSPTLDQQRSVAEGARGVKGVPVRGMSAVGQLSWDGGGSPEWSLRRRGGGAVLRRGSARAHCVSGTCAHARWQVRDSLVGDNHEALTLSCPGMRRNIDFGTRTLKGACCRGRSLVDRQPRPGSRRVRCTRLKVAGSAEHLRAITAIAGC